MRLPHPTACAVLSALWLLSACDTSSGGVPQPEPSARLLVTADTAVLERAATPPDGVSLDRLRAALAAPHVEANYRLTTPADTPFAFDLVSWSAGGGGIAAVAVVHLADGDRVPAGDGTSLAAAGIVPNGRALRVGNGRVEARGDGFVRLSLQGRIERDQLLAVTSDTGAITLVELRLGDRSPINRQPRDGQPQPDVVARHTIYSSDSMSFGLPTIAVSGDRTSIVCYEGDRQAAFGDRRYEMRLQHDAATGAVTGGGSVETSADTGYWRDHEVAALHNVLAVVRAEADGVRVRLSFDRGATFAQVVELPVGAVQARLVQTAIAADYALAVVCWRPRSDGTGLDLVLVEGHVAGVDGNGSPTWFGFDAPQVVHTMPFESAPLTTGLAWSDGGDLVIGYGATWFTSGTVWTSTTEFRCATRRHGEVLRDRLVDREEILGMDPTVAVLGRGASMRIYYAYETRTGLRLATSVDGGDTFARGPSFGHPGDHLPAVFARDVAGAVRLDVLYLAARENGTELHQARWLGGPAGPREDFALTEARLGPLPGGSVPTIWSPAASGSMRSTQVAWLGFDAVRDGDALVAVYDEVTVEAMYLCFGGGAGLPPSAGLSVPGVFAGFQPAAPPPLAPGMTEPVPPVDAAHAHQLVLLRIE